MYSNQNRRGIIIAMGILLEGHGGKASSLVENAVIGLLAAHRALPEVQCNYN